VSTHCFKQLLGALLVVGAFSLVGSTPAYADVNTNGFFELDANTVDPVPATLPDDWDDIPANTLHTSATTGIVHDSDPKVFTQGSKDINDLNTWAWRAGSSPSKADIQNAYAAAYNDAGHLVVYFGADRLSTNGTVATGFWFFKNPVCAKANKTFGAGNADTNGNCTDPNAPAPHHADGDVLVAVNYDNGGHVGTIAVYEWTGGALVTKAISNNQLGTAGLFCNEFIDNNPDIPAGAICAITNKDPIQTAWTGSANLVAGQFFEGGIDITAIIPGAQCFASFMATSRSSTTTNAEIKNFVLGNFPVCGIKVGKACDTTNNPPSINPDGKSVHVTFVVPITSTGLGTISNVTLAEDASALTDKTCTLISVDGTAVNTPLTTDPTQVKATLTGTTNVVVACDSTSNPVTNTVNVTAMSNASLSTPDLTASHTTGSGETCGVAPTPELNVTKSCNPQLAVLDGNGTFSYTICNDFTITSTTTEQLVGIGVTDSVGGAIFSNATLAPGATQTVSKCYTSSTPNDGLGQTDPTKVGFKDQITNLTFTGAISKQTVTKSTANGDVLPSASCPICPKLP
jgi:hypothetical protein